MKTPHADFVNRPAKLTESNEYMGMHTYAENVDERGVVETDEHEAWITALAATDPGGWLWEHDVRRADSSVVDAQLCNSEHGWVRVDGGEHPLAGFGSAGEFAQACAHVWQLGHRLPSGRHRLLVRSCDHLGWQAEVRW